MKKDNIRDYATSAFRNYARLGCPTTEEFKKHIRKIATNNVLEPQKALMLAEKAEAESYPEIMDIEAVNGTISILEKSGKHEAVLAIKEIYFIKPDKPLRKCNISERAQALAISMPADIRTIYRYLALARRIFAELRGLSFHKTCQ